MQLLRAVSPAFGAGRPDATGTGGAVGHLSSSRAERHGEAIMTGGATRSAPGLPTEYGVASTAQAGDAAADRHTPPSVSASEARALIELMSARGIAQGELAGLLGLDKSTVSRLAAGLERKGWIRRGRDEDNQRYVRLYLTPQGGEVAERVWQAWQSRQARILSVLSADERAGLSAGLRGLIRGLVAEGLLGEATSGS